MYEFLLFIHVFCLTSVLLSTYFHVPGDQGGPLFSDRHLFAGIFMYKLVCYIMYCYSSVVSYKFVYKNLYDIQILILKFVQNRTNWYVQICNLNEFGICIYKFMYYTNLYTPICTVLYKFVYNSLIALLLMSREILLHYSKTSPINKHASASFVSASSKNNLTSSLSMFSCTYQPNTQTLLGKIGKANLHQTLTLSSNLSVQHFSTHKTSLNMPL
jgi:hypothetical protein